MNFTLPAHLRKKDEDTVAHLFEKEVECEIEALTKKLKEAAANMKKSSKEIGIKAYSDSVDFQVDVFDGAYGYIEGDDAAVKAEIMQAYVAGDEKKFFALHGALYKDEIVRQAERNVEENEVDSGD